MVKFGIIGTGRMAAAMMPAFAASSAAAVTAICSQAEDRARAFADTHDIDHAYGDRRAFLDSDMFDAVYVANLNRFHAEAAIAALEAGKHVLCEKPFAMNAKEGERVIAAAHASGKLFMEGLWTLLLPSYKRVFEAVRSNEVGAPRLLSAAYGYPTTKEASQRLFEPEDGGVLLDLSVYPLSLALRMFGAIEELDVKVVRDPGGVDLEVVFHTTHANGARAQLAASFLGVMSNQAHIACERGLISIDAPLFGAETIRIAAHGNSAGAPSGAKAKLISLLKSNPIARKARAMVSTGGEYHGYGANQYSPQLGHFLSLIERGSVESDIVRHDFSLSVIRAVDRIREREELTP